MTIILSSIAEAILLLSYSRLLSSGLFLEIAGINQILPQGVLKKLGHRHPPFCGSTLDHPFGLGGDVDQELDWAIIHTSMIAPIRSNGKPSRIVAQLCTYPSLC